MIENKDARDRRDGDVETAAPDGDSDTDFEPPVRATNVLNDITRLPDTVNLLHRSMAGSHVAGITKVLDQSLAVSRVSGIFKALDQSLAVSQVSGIFKALDQSLAVSQVSGIFKALDQSLAVSQRANALSKEHDDAFALLTRRLRDTQEIQKRPASFVERRADEHLAQGAIWFGPRMASVVDTISTEESQLALIKYDMLVTEDGLHQACRSLFRSGHYAEAVRMAFTYLDNIVREKSGHAEKDGADLMRFVFSADKPLLKLNDLETRSDRNEQQGYMQMLAGAMTAIRNPRSHEYDLTDRPEEALEMLVMANHFIRVLNKAALT